MSSRDHVFGTITQGDITINLLIVDTATGHGSVETDYEVHAVRGDTLLAVESTEHWNAANRIFVRMQDQFFRGVVPPAPPGPYDSNEAYGRF